VFIAAQRQGGYFAQVAHVHEVVFAPPGGNEDSLQRASDFMTGEG
jgi:hypothetical protein